MSHSIEEKAKVCPVMSYAKTIVCLANSFKTGGWRVAGKEKVADGQYGDWIRPVSGRESAELNRAESSYANYRMP
jgi:hypothetical protein